MGEKFAINIDCSKILFDNETQYTMFIDTTKISIVYELVEWIRWMFSIKCCIYLLHENSVIHELEDIQFLSKLKNFEIKPCGRPCCVHKTTYRSLLSNLNLFVSWNEMKVPKYFVNKLNQIDQKLTQVNNEANTSMMISSNISAHEGLTDCKNSNITTVNDNFFFSDSQLSNSSVKDSSFNKKTLVTDYLDSEPIGNSKCKLNMRSCFDESPIHSPLKNKSEILGVANNCTKPKSRKSTSKHVKPFSVGEILSNIRRDFEEQNTKTAVKKNVPSVNFSVSGKDFNDKMTAEDSFLINGDKIIERKKRQRTRTRKRKSTKMRNLENVTFTSPYLESNRAISSINYPRSNSALKPNHIRFDVNDEDNVVNNKSVEDNISLLNNNENKNENDNEFEIINEKMNDSSSSTFFKTNTEKSLSVLNDKCQSLSDSQLVNSSMRNTDNDMDCSTVVDDLIQIKEKQIDSGDQISNGMNQPSSEPENCQSASYNPHLNMLASLTNSCKNSVVVERFY